MFKHFYSRYGLALTMLNNKLASPEEVTAEMLIRELENGQNHFRFEPLPFEIENGKVKFQYLKKAFFEDNQKSISSQGKFLKEIGGNRVAEISYFLSPTIITSNKGSKNTWKGIVDIIHSLKKSKNIISENVEAKMSVFPISGKINNGKMSQSNPRSSLLEIACGAITTTTDKKPAMLIGNAEPVCILPDLEIENLQKFIAIFEKNEGERDKEFISWKGERN
jgi:hypothetical protein